ncbi:MAG: hypothetical protein ACPGJE_01345 [Wenzhouxiangellaceae bacterium]
MKSPVLIQADLIGTTDQPAAPRLLPVLAELHQTGVPLLLLSARPDHWAPTRNRVDRVFLRQADIEADLRRAGGALDAIVYLDFGLFSRRRQHERNLADIANRYGCKLEDLHLITRPGRMYDALKPLVGDVSLIEQDGDVEAAIREQVRNG